MAVTPYRSTLTIDGTKINALSTKVVFQTDKDRAGMPQMGSLKTAIRVFIDFHDDTNVPHSALKNLFELANVVTKDKIKDIKVEFWKDDKHLDALCSYAFRGWVSGFQTCNPASDGSDVNHLLIVDLEPALDQQNFVDIRMSN
jgi:hypothetical protein